MMPSDVDPFARTVLGLVADSALRALLLAGAMGVAIVWLRRKGAAARMSAWTVVLYAAIALPALLVVVPTWRWPVPSVPVFADWTSAPAGQTIAATDTVVVAGETGTLFSATPVKSALTGPVIAAAIYVTGVVLFLIRAGAGWLATRRLRLSAQHVTDAGALERLGRHSAAAGLAQRPQLVESARLFVPLTMSVWRPIVALPADWRNWPKGRLDAVLAHEVAHVARRDALTQHLSLFYRAILWCSPFSWWLHQHLSDLAEQASDEAALQAGINPTTYAETLLDFFVRLQGTPRRAEWHVAMARRADAAAARRVERILSWEGSPMQILRRSKVFVVGLVLAMAPVLAIAASVRGAEDATPPLPLSTSFIAPANALEVAPPAISLSAPAAVKQSSVPKKPAAPAPQPKPKAQAVPPQTEDDFAKGAYQGDAPGVAAPIVLYQPKPKYTSNAMRAKLQGSVHVEIIIMPDGTVGKTRIKHSLDSVTGLDEQALIAARSWTFVPGTLQGQPVPIYAVIILEFRLH